MNIKLVDSKVQDPSVLVTGRFKVTKIPTQNFLQLDITSREDQLSNELLDIPKSVTVSYG